jgi:ATP-dependent DNA helicase Rep
MIMDIDYENWLRQQTASDKAAEFRISNVWFLVEALKNTLEKDEEGDMTIEDAIGKLVLRDMLERQQEEEENAEGVQMMTLHASKGLEFPYVFIMGMEEEILPHRSSIEADTIEERRLAYVGITRARQTLAFTFAAKRKQYGEIIDCTPSRFLDELPPDDLAWEGLDDAPVEVKAARGNNAWPISGRCSNADQPLLFNFAAICGHLCYIEDTQWKHCIRRFAKKASCFPIRS